MNERGKYTFKEQQRSLKEKSSIIGGAEKGKV